MVCWAGGWEWGGSSGRRCPAMRDRRWPTRGDGPDPSPPVQAEPSPPARADPSPLARADPRPPVRADPNPPVRADPSPPAWADPRPPARARSTIGDRRRPRDCCAPQSVPHTAAPLRLSLSPGVTLQRPGPSSPPHRSHPHPGTWVALRSAGCDHGLFLDRVIVRSSIELRSVPSHDRSTPSQCGHNWLRQRVRERKTGEGRERERKTE